MSYSAVTRLGLGSVAEGCPNQYYLIDKDDEPSCADACPAGWEQTIDAETGVNYCFEPLKLLEPPQPSPTKFAAVGHRDTGLIIGCFVLGGLAAVLVGVVKRKE